MMSIECSGNKGIESKDREQEVQGWRSTDKTRKKPQGMMLKI